MGKPILCLDFDGVVHSYTSGWKGARNIPDPPVDGAIEFMGDALASGWDVVIHSSRARYFGGITAMRGWLKEHSGNLWDTMGASMCDVRFTRWKPSALVTIDDRALTFTGVWPSLNGLRNFKPWNKRPNYEAMLMQGDECILCANGNDLPDGEHCRACGRLPPILHEENTNG